MRYEKPRPRIGPDNAPFWQGCREHRLMLPTHGVAGSVRARTDQQLDDRSQGVVPGVQG